LLVGLWLLAKGAEDGWITRTRQSDTQTGFHAISNFLETPDYPQKKKDPAHKTVAKPFLILKLSFIT
jgi:hypothetical protein